MKLLILAGGSGTRLFPLSRTCYPKQFLKIAGKKSLLQQTIERFVGIVKPSDILVITNSEHAFLVKSLLEEIGAEEAHIISEPIGRNTAPAIALGMAYAKSVFDCKSDECFFVTPADHKITPDEEFQKIVLKAENTAKEKSSIVTIGVKPTAPETGYGYIHAYERLNDDSFKVDSFKEKPDVKTAEQYLTSGDYYWNAGMFVFSLECMETAFERYAHEILEIYERGYDSIINSFVSMPNISIDYAVAEKAENMAVVPMENVFWSDIGSFDAIADLTKDSQGNSIFGDVIANDSNNNMVLADKRLISLIGIEDTIVVDTADTLLICKKGRSQEVKDIVAELKEKKRKELIENVMVHRPWGDYTILSEGEGYKVKRICVNAGAKLSLQMHYHRSEHWTVISGIGKVTVDDKVVFCRENESTFIPIATKHRLENPGNLPLIIIEVQNGRYLGEDDIVRFDDVYGR